MEQLFGDQELRDVKDVKVGNGKVGKHSTMFSNVLSPETWVGWLNMVHTNGL